MRTLTTFKSVVDLWPTRAALEADLLAQSGRAAPVREWHKRDRIPAKWFDAVIAVAAKRGFEGVTYPLLAELYKKDGSLRIEDAF